MSKSVDSFFSSLSSTWRAVVALGAAMAIAFSAGAAFSAMGNREAIADLQQTDTDLRNDISTNRATAASIASQVATIESVIQQTGLVEMSERVRRIDRELCLLRAGQAGTVTPQMQQECARR